jgi:hypothetical protein
MAKLIRVAVIILCVLSVLAICIAPLVDLPATKLPSGLLVVLLMCWLVASSVVTKTRKLVHLSAGIWFDLPEQALQYVLQPIDNNCVMQC